MPLSKLFQKRNSLRDIKTASCQNQENKTCEIKEHSEVLPTNCTSGAEQCVSVSGLNELKSIATSQIEMESMEDAAAVVTNNSCLPDTRSQVENRTSSSSSEDNQSVSLMQKEEMPKVIRNKPRSSSTVSGYSKPIPCKSGRRKYGSEGGIFNISPDDEGFEDKIIQFKEKDLEKVIGHYVQRLIQESITTAVNSVHFENLYEEVIKDVSECSQSENSGDAEVIEQKLKTSSVTEYVDLDDREQNAEDNFNINDSNTTNENLLDEAVTKTNNSIDTRDCSLQECIYENDSEEVKDSNLDGYQADIEESGSCMSLPLESSTENLKILKAQFEEPTNVLTSDSEDKEVEPEKAERSISSNVIIESEAGKTNEAACVDTGSLGDNDLKNEPEVAELPKMQTQKSSDSVDLINMSIDSDGDSQVTTETESTADELTDLSSGLGENLPEQQQSTDEEKKVKWKVGYLHVKLPHKARNKGHLKVWKKRCVSIQPDEFVNDPNNPCLMISVYSGESGVARKHSASFWKSVSGKKAVVYRSNSRTHPYTFTISEDNKALIHLAAESESATQEWMSAIRAILWPPSPVIQLEKMLNGSEFEISIIDNEFSYHAGLLGMYGYLTITPKKLILVHPQQGYVIQEWYLNTVDKFQLMPQTRIEDVHKVLAMTTCSDSSTGRGELLIFCNEAVVLLQSLASTIHQILTYHSKQEGGKYQKELEEIAEWLVPPQAVDGKAPTEDYYKVPPRQVKSLLDIPNFIFDKPLSPVASVACSSELSMESAVNPSLETMKTNPATTSHDSGISAGTVADDFLNCSVTSFVVGGGGLPGKSSDSELSDTYTPPHSPAVKLKKDEKQAPPTRSVSNN